MKATFAVCVLVLLAISASECGPEKRQELPVFCTGSDLATCVADYGATPSSICSGACRDTLEQYGDECLTGDAAEQYLDTLDEVCDATTATATLVSTVTALIVAVAAAFN